MLCTLPSGETLDRYPLYPVAIALGRTGQPGHDKVKMGGNLPYWSKRARIPVPRPAGREGHEVISQASWGTRRGEDGEDGA